MQRFVILLCAALLLLPLLVKNRKSQEPAGHTVFRVLPSGRIYVKVSGAVVHPGIYVVSANSLADSVILLTQPTRQLNQYKKDTAASRPLVNGTALKLSVQPDNTLLLTADKMSVAEKMILGIPLDIATMSETDFDRLPGIGPALSRRIITYRQNNGGILQVSDLAAIEGIGEKKYNLIIPYFQISEKTR